MAWMLMKPLLSWTWWLQQGAGSLQRELLGGKEGKESDLRIIHLPGRDGVVLSTKQSVKQVFQLANNRVVLFQMLTDEGIHSQGGFMSLKCLLREVERE
ncbi:hypothetical protein L861_00015 [Litchfieldella anticariensis FP35 = DSM 16096]|uniref:Uncharacterized protein n=1 Tax=Litchfieldella anticariensis (strain DSM 16096 / CECT 5854 / CIP 108499 / LMG 22089 / FP35) TaxID=1121939 RepID=S2L9S9_LITA3|nr:hypothetical protein L861_00015 [Halomonas anticariensis FP35 = DSM 16096]